MALIRRRGKRWQAVIRRKGWPKQSRAFAVRADAEAWSREIESEMDRGVFVRRDLAESITLKELIERYAAEVVPTHKGKESEALRCDALAKTDLASRIVATLRRRDFSDYGRARLKVRKPATVRREIQLFHAAIEWARDEEDIYLPDNPARRVKLPPLNNERQRRLLPGEEELLLAAATAPDERTRAADGTFQESGTLTWWLLPLIVLAIETAMRRGELLALTWRDIDLERRVAQLHTSKNGKPRKVPLSTRAIETLRAMPRTLHGPLIPATPNAVKLAWPRLLARARKSYLAECDRRGKPDEGLLSGLRLHDLRHEGTSRLAERVPNVVELSAITGHLDLNMLRRYYHPSAERLAEKLA
jgi:integrase